MLPTSFGVHLMFSVDPLHYVTSKFCCPHSSVLSIETLLSADLDVCSGFCFSRCTSNFCSSLRYMPTFLGQKIDGGNPSYHLNRRLWHWLIEGCFLRAFLLWIDTIFLYISFFKASAHNSQSYRKIGRTTAIVSISFSQFGPQTFAISLLS